MSKPQQWAPLQLYRNSTRLCGEPRSQLCEIDIPTPVATEDVLNILVHVRPPTASGKLSSNDA
jgi:hypothetical protein